MSANPDLRLVAIDPGLAHVGLAVVTVQGLSQLVLERSTTVNTRVKAPWLERVHAIADGIADYLDEVDGSGYVVIEDPTALLRTDPEGRRHDPRRIQELCAAYGVIVCSALSYVAPTCLSVPPVGAWYPRADRGHMKKAHVLAHIRARYPQLVGQSEHVAMAVGLADWWSRNVAPRLWYEAAEAASRAKVLV